MKKLILHIGTQKTGTSALQEFFCLNISRLAKMGIDFPLFPGRYKFHEKREKYYNTKRRNGHFLLDYTKSLCMQNVLHENKITSQKDAELFRQYTLQHHSQILLTEESLFGHTLLCKEFWPELKNFFISCDVKQVDIVVYLRRQDQYLVSSWKQNLKSSWHALSCQEYADCYFSGRLDYDAHLTQLENVFGHQHIIVRRYERNLFAGGDIYHDFCEAVGIPWRDDFVLPLRDINPSLDCSVAEIKRLMNLSMERSGNQFLFDSFLTRLIQKYSKECSEDAGLSPLTSEETAALLARYEEGNRNIAERYFGERSLFSNEINDEKVWKRDPEKLLTEAVDFLTQALIQEYFRANRLALFSPIRLFLNFCNHSKRFIKNILFSDKINC